MVAVFRISGPDPVARDDHPMVSVPGTGNPTWKCAKFTSARFAEIT
jgi:hypothetical protein